MSTPDPIIQHLEQDVTSIFLLHWSTGLTERYLHRKYIKWAAVYANKVQKSFTTTVVSLNSCHRFLTVLVYMHEQQNCSHKAWHIYIEIISNGCSRISLRIFTGKKF